MNCELKSGVNDCYWNVEGRCTSFEVTGNKPVPSFISRDWDSKRNCTLTQNGVQLCGVYLPEGKVL